MICFFCSLTTEKNDSFVHLNIAISVCCVIFHSMNIEATTLPDDTTLLKQMLVDL